MNCAIYICPEARETKVDVVPGVEGLRPAPLGDHGLPRVRPQGEGHVAVARPAAETVQNFANLKICLTTLSKLADFG